MIPAKSLERLSGEPLIAVSTSPCSICAFAAGLPGFGWRKIAPYGTAMPRLAANSAVIGLTATPIQPQRSLPFWFSCVTVALHIAMRGVGQELASPDHSMGFGGDGEQVVPAQLSPS
jgi:hypothetical protein